MCELQQRIDAFTKYKQETEAQIKKEASKLKSDFEDFISNKSVPLLERWELFSNTDDSLKNNYQWLIQGKRSGLKYVMDHWFNDFGQHGKGKVINISELLEELAYRGEFHPDCFDNNLPEDEALSLLKETLEEVLERNLGSFVYDW